MKYLWFWVVPLALGISFCAAIGFTYLLDPYFAQRKQGAIPYPAKPIDFGHPCTDVKFTSDSLGVHEIKARCFDGNALVSISVDTYQQTFYMWFDPDPKGTFRYSRSIIYTSEYPGHMKDFPALITYKQFAKL